MVAKFHDCCLSKVASTIQLSTSCQLQPHPPLYLHFSIAATGISKGVCHFDVTSGPVKCYMVLLCGTEVNGNPLGLDYLHPDGAVYR